MIRLGQTFVNKEARGVPPHLWVVVSDPAKNPEQVVIVNLTTLKDKSSDHSCVVEPDEHRFVSRRSYVKYSMAKCVSIGKLEVLLKSNSLSSSTDVSADLLRRIQKGMTNSPFARMELCEILREQGFVAF